MRVPEAPEATLSFDFDCSENTDLRPPTSDQKPIAEGTG